MSTMAAVGRNDDSGDDGGARHRHSLLGHGLVEEGVHVGVFVEEGKEGFAKNAVEGGGAGLDGLTESGPDFVLHVAEQAGAAGRSEPGTSPRRNSPVGGESKSGGRGVH